MEKVKKLSFPVRKGCVTKEEKFPSKTTLKSISLMVLMKGGIKVIKHAIKRDWYCLIVYTDAHFNPRSLMKNSGSMCLACIQY